MKQVSSCGLELFYFGLFCANSTHFSSLWLMLLLFSSSASVGLFRKGLLALPGKHSNHPHPKNEEEQVELMGWGHLSIPLNSMEENGSFGSTNRCTQQVLGHGTQNFNPGRLLEPQGSHNLFYNKSSTASPAPKSMAIWGEENPMCLLINY